MAVVADTKLKAFFETNRKLPYQIFLAKDNAQFEELTEKKTTGKIMVGHWTRHFRK